MIQSINAGNTGITNTAAVQIQTSKDNDEKTAEEKKSLEEKKAPELKPSHDSGSKIEVSADGDIVEISEEATNKSKDQAGQSTETAVSAGNTSELALSEKSNLKVELSADGDIIEISQKAASKAEEKPKMPPSSGGVQTAENEDTSTETEATTIEEVVDKLNSSGDDEDEDSTDTSDLTQYSESELKDMVASGTITNSEYTAEIERREGSSNSNVKTNDNTEVSQAENNNEQKAASVLE